MTEPAFTHACLLATGSQDYLSPRQVLLGDGSVGRLGESLHKWGVPDGPVAVISDRVVADAGITDPVMKALEAAGFTPHLFSGIEGEPTLATAEAALDAVRSCGAIAVIGVGGGSAMDVAKIAALAGFSAELRAADFIGIDVAAAGVLPLALVPTTTGTGAEVTRISMLSEGGKKVISSHRLLVPTVAVLDAELVMGLPPAVTAATGMDAMAHAVEAFLSTNRSALSIAASLTAIELLRDALPRSVADGGDRLARRATLYGAHLAGQALNAGVVLGHSLAYTIANRTHLPHGVTCAIALPYCMAYNASAAVPGVDQLALAITGGRSGDLLAAADYILALSQQLGIPSTLSQIGIADDQVAEMAQECVERYPRPTNPVPFELGRLTRLVAAMHGGDLAAARALDDSYPEETTA
jgi:alcohol dehydrogenase class IV